MASHTPGFLKRRVLLVALLLASLGIAGAALAGASVAPGSGEQWTSTGGPAADGGEVSALVVDKSAPGTAYAAVEAAGVATIYRTTDRGANWAQRFSMLGQVNTLAVDGGRLYAGMSDAPAGQAAILRSLDGGLSWTSVYTAAVTTTIRRLAVDLGTTSVFAAAQAGTEGVVLSTANDHDWTAALTVPGDMVGLSMNPATPNQLFAGAQNTGNGWAEVYRSDNSGAGWTRVLTSTERLSFLQVHPITPDVVFATTRPSGCCPPPPANLRRSDDGGDTWKIVSTNENFFGMVFSAPDSLYSIYRGVTFTDNASADSPAWTLVGDQVLPEWSRSVAVDDAEPRLFYAGLETSGVYTSTDDGWTFAPANHGIATLGLPSALRFDPGVSGALYAAGDQGLSRSTNGGDDWTNIFALTSARDVAVQPGNSQLLLLGAENPRSNQPAVYRSADGGLNWTPVYTPNILYRYHSSRALAFDPIAPVRAYAVTACETPGNETINTIVRSENAGLTWTPVMTSTGVYPGLAVLAVARDGTVYAGGEEGWEGSESAIVVRSTDHGDHWSHIYAAARAAVLGLITDPNDARIVYLIDSTNHLRKSSDSGDNWTPVYTSPAPLRALSQDPVLSGRLYLGADGPTVLVSPDGGGSWSELAGWGGAVVSPQVSSLAVDKGWPVQTLYAGLNGVWRRSQDTPGSRVFLPLVLR